MNLPLSSAGDKCWFAYITRGVRVSASGRSRDEARLRLLQKLQALGLPLADPELFNLPGDQSDPEAFATRALQP